MRSLYISFLLILIGSYLTGQDQLDDNESLDSTSTFSIFIGKYTSVDSLISIQHELNSIGHNIKFQN